MHTNTTTIEEWRPVVKRGPYMISSHGRVWSIPRTIPISCVGRRTYLRHIRGRYLVPQVEQAGGHLWVGLANQEQHNGRRKANAKIHLLVAAAFIGPRPFGLICRHLDGDTNNNQPHNLAYGTMLENSADMIAHGNSCRGERNSQSKLTEESVLDIYRRVRSDESRASLAVIFGVSKGQIRHIDIGESWSCLTGQA